MRQRCARWCRDKRTDILIQFLAEAVLLSVIGGLVDVGLGVWGARMITLLLGGSQALVTAQSIGLALHVSLGISIFFGSLSGQSGGASMVY